MKLTKGQGKAETAYTLTLDKTRLLVQKSIGGVWAKPSQTRYPTQVKAKAAYEARIAKLVAEGFRDPLAAGEPPPATLARDPKLEAAIRADRDDAGAYSVYADWLQQHGNPLGELIVLAQQRSKLFGKRLARLGLPPEGLATCGWRHGMWQWLRLENIVDWMDDSWDPLPLARNVFAQTACAALEELRFGVLRWDHNFEDIPAVIGEAARHAWAADLPRLHLGNTRNVDLAHHQVGPVGKPISKAFPGLRWLKIRSSEATWRRVGETFSLRGLALPVLEELIVETCSMSKARLAEILATKLPALERLTLWFGDPDYGADAGVKGLAKLLSGAAFPKLRHLGLMNAACEDEIAVAVSTSQLAPQLESLDLSMGTMTEPGAEALIAARPRFRALAALNVSGNFLSAQTARAVKQAFPFAVVKDQKEPDEYDGETDYYVSVHE